MGERGAGSVSGYIWYFERSPKTSLGWVRLTLAGAKPKWSDRESTQSPIALQLFHFTRWTINVLTREYPCLAITQSFAAALHARSLAATAVLAQTLPTSSPCRLSLFVPPSIARSRPRKVPRIYQTTYLTHSLCTFPISRIRLPRIY
jgi:hypothetical protein